MKNLNIRNPFLQEYLTYVEDTESPRIFHIWTALSNISACLGRRCYFPFGVGDIYPNQYILLVGPPAVKKSTAIKIGQRLISETTGVRFAPDDTGGARQGLITAIENKQNDENIPDEEVDLALEQFDFGNLEKIGELKVNNSFEDKHHLYIVASEFNTFIGIRETPMLNFLGKLWDGEDFTYGLKKETSVLKNGLLNLIGGTTPTNIAIAMPPAAIGGGFMSRLILVHADAKYKSVARPSPLNPEIGVRIKEVMSWAYYTARGEFKETAEARKFLDSFYEVETRINDARFMYYCDRRHTHLIKLTMALTAGRMSQTITPDDISDAHAILSYTETNMTEALGEFGLSPLSAAKQKMLEFIRHCKVPVTETILWAVMVKDMQKVDFLNSLNDLTNTRKIIQVTTKKYGAAYLFNTRRHEEVDAVMNELAVES